MDYSSNSGLSIAGHTLSRAEVELILYAGYSDEEVALLASLRDPAATAEPGFLVDIYGIRTRATSLWVEAQAHDGRLLGHPMPGNFHWEVIEWIGLMRSVLEANESFRIMELGAGWGPAVVSGSVLARLRGIDDIRMTGVEGDPRNYRSMVQHVIDNGFDPNHHHLYEGTVAAKAGETKWPVRTNEANNYGLGPIQGAEDYMGRSFDRTLTAKTFALRDLVVSETHWDLIHMDVQGAEFVICQSAMAELNERARRVMIGTHSRKIEGDLIALFSAAGWLLENEKPCKFTFSQNPRTLEAMTTVDGTQTWRNPRVGTPQVRPKRQPRWSDWLKPRGVQMRY